MSRHPNDFLAPVVVDWRPAERIVVRWSPWSAYLLSTIYALVAGIIFAVPATRAHDVASAALLVGVGFVLAFPITLFVCQSRYPAGHVVIDPRKRELLRQVGARNEGPRSLDDLQAIVIESSAEAHGRFALRARFSDETVLLLTADNISSAGGHVLETEIQAVETLASDMAETLKVGLERGKFQPTPVSFSAMVRNPTWPARIGALVSLGILVYLLRGIPAIPVLVVAFVAGVVVRSQISHPAVRWLGALLAMGGVACFFLTVALYGQHTETPWDTPAIPRWIGGIVAFFGGGLFALGNKIQSKPA